MAGPKDANDLAALQGLPAVAELVAQARPVTRGKASRAKQAPVPEQGSTLSPLAYNLADQLKGNGDAPDELVEGLLCRRDISVLVGASGVGKSFVALSIAAAICRGEDWIGGRRVERGFVAYLATEAAGSMRNRARAYQQHHACLIPHLAIVSSPVNLWDGYADTQRVIDLVRTLETEHGEKCELIVGDTWAAMTPGANENSGEDMGLALKHVAAIRDECRAHIMLVAHHGKDESRGLRGWSGVRAAVDTEIEVTADKDTGLHTIAVRKQRDLPGLGARIGFRLRTVDMGTGKWGLPMTSCVIEPAEAAAAVPPARRVSEIAGAVIEVLTSHGTGMKKSDLAKRLADRYRSSSVYRELKQLVEAGRLLDVVGVVAIAKPKVPNGTN